MDLVSLPGYGTRVNCRDIEVSIGFVSGVRRRRFVKHSDRPKGVSAYRCQPKMCSPGGSGFVRVRHWIEKRWQPELSIVRRGKLLELEVGRRSYKGFESVEPTH